MPLHTQKCAACQTGSPALSRDELADLMPEVSKWQLVVVDTITRITREFHFNNFKEALAFTLSVGELAEVEGHHPEIVTRWGSVRITWWTHAINGLHRNDFICAAKTDKLFQE